MSKRLLFDDTASGSETAQAEKRKRPNLNTLNKDSLGHLSQYLIPQDKQNVAFASSELFHKSDRPLKDAPQALLAVAKDVTNLQRIKDKEVIDGQKYSADLLEFPLFIKAVLKEQIIGRDENTGRPQFRADDIKYVLNCISPRLRRDGEFILAVFRTYGPPALEVADPALFQDKDFITSALSYSDERPPLKGVIERIGDKLLQDDKFMISLFNLQVVDMCSYCPKAHDRAFMLKYLAQTDDSFYLPNINGRDYNPLTADPVFMIAAVQKCGIMSTLVAAADALFDDKDFLATLIFAEREADFPIDIIRNNACSSLFKYTHDSFFESEDNVYMAFAESKHFGQEQDFLDCLHGKDQNFILKTMEVNPGIVQFANPAYFDDPEFNKRVKADALNRGFDVKAAILLATKTNATPADIVKAVATIEKGYGVTEDDAKKIIGV